MKTFQYKIRLTRPYPSKTREIDNNREYAQAYLAQPIDKYEIGYKSFHSWMEDFARGKLERLLDLGWQPLKKLKFI